MSFYDNSSLAFLPSSGAGKSGKAYSIKPTDGTGDFTFSRGSNLTATRVGPTGLIEKGRENLLLQSNQFDTTWVKSSSITLTSGQSGYDGSSDAWLLESDGSAGVDSVFQSVSSSGVNTCSIYAKAGTNSIFLLRAAGLDARATFDLSTISVSTNSQVIDASIEQVGTTDWYRCSMYFNGTANLVLIYPNNLSAPIVGSIYIQDAQLEVGLAATDYIESGASTGKAGLLENEPRFDYSGGATCPSLLLEPQRVQLMGYTEFFGSGSGWNSISASPAVITDNFGISPEGLQNAAKLAFGGTNSWLGKTFSSVAGEDYSASVYLKVEDGGADFNVTLTYYPTGGGTRLDKAVTITSEWQRFDALFENVTPGTGASNFVIRSNETRSCLVWGAQMEQGSYPTSYIPNHSGGSATRTAETSLVTDIDSLFGSNNTFYSEFIYYTSNTSTFLEVNQNGGAANLLQISATSSNKINYTIFANGSFVASRSTNVVLTDGVMKVALKYDGINYKVFLNGSLIDTYAQTSIPVSLNRIYCGNARGAQQFGKGISQTLLFPEALSDADCITLTT